MLSEGLYNLITKDPTVGALLAKNAVYPALMPEAAPLPAIVYQEVHGDGTMSQDGPDPLQYSRMQFDCYGAKYGDAKQLARALRQLLEGTTGLLSDGTVLENAERISESDTFEDTPRIFRTMLEMKIVYGDLSA